MQRILQEKGDSLSHLVNIYYHVARKCCGSFILQNDHLFELEFQGGSSLCSSKLTKVTSIKKEKLYCYMKFLICQVVQSGAI